MKKKTEHIIAASGSLICMALCQQQFANWQSAIYMAVMYAAWHLAGTFITSLTEEIKDTNRRLDRAHRQSRTVDWRVG